MQPLSNFLERFNLNIILQTKLKQIAALLQVLNEVSLTKPGNRIHEMGSARMGRDPANSVLNQWCQAHDVPNLFITDGSFMASSACQNPSLTYMAFSARAAHYAADLIADGTL